MLPNNLNKIYFMIIFVLISLLLLNIYPVITTGQIVQFIKSNKNLNKNPCSIDPLMKGIRVPPTQYGHPKCCPQSGRLKYPNTWKYLAPDNNIPGLLPGPRPGDLLGLDNNPDLSLSTPIKAPLVDNIIPTKCKSESNYMNQIKDNVLKNCMLNATEKAMVKTLPASLYYKYRYYQCNPYNGSYCQCTNNYIPLPPVGMCQSNGLNENVCPYKYRVKPSTMYLDTQKCLKNQFY